MEMKESILKLAANYFLCKYHSKKPAGVKKAEQGFSEVTE